MPQQPQAPEVFISYKREPKSHALARDIKASIEKDAGSVTEDNNSALADNFGLMPQDHPVQVTLRRKPKWVNPVPETT